MTTPVFAVGGAGIQLGEGGLAYALVAMAVLFALSFFFSGTETAMFSLQKVERQRLKRGNTTDQQAYKLLSRRQALITTILMGNEAVNIGIAALGAALILALTGNSLLNVIVVTPLLVLFSEITPKVLAFRFNQRWTRLATWPLTVFYLAVTPIRWLVGSLVRTGAKAFRVTEAPEDERLQEDEILDIIEESALKGNSDVEQREHELVESVFEFDDLTVERVMTPRPDVFAVPMNIGWSRLLKLCREASFSRVPVYRRRPDDIAGVLLIKDLLGYRSAPPNTPRELQSLLVPATFVPASKPTDDMLREFLKSRTHMAFVVDEHGTFVGLVTLDDLLAELLDHETEEQEEIRQVAPGTFVVKGWMDIEDFAEETSITLPEGDYNTVGGFVFHELGRLPRRGDAIEIDNRRYTIGGMQGRRIQVVRVEPVAAPGSGHHTPAGPDREAG